MNATQQQEPTRHRAENQYDDEINLIDYLRVLWKWKVFIILMAVLCSGLAIGITTVKYPAKYVTSCIISLNFPGIEEHKNPDNTMFAKEHIITPDIITKATSFLQKKDKSFPEKDLRGMIGIDSIIPSGIQEQMKKAEKGKESYTFFPNQFSLTLTQQKDGIFSIKEKKQLLLSIVDEYRKDFEKKYGEEPLVVVEFLGNFLLDSDYLDAINTFKVRVDSFIKFLDSKIAKAGFFRSKKTSDSFADIKNDLKLLNNINISKTEAIIKTLSLTKNKDNLINLYKYKIRGIDVERKKKEKEALIVRNLLKDIRQQERYETSKGVFSKKGDSGLVLDTSFIKELVNKDTSSFLLKAVLEAEVNAKNLEVDKECLEEEIVLLKEKEKEKEKENIAVVETNLKDIEGRIIALSKRANELNMEYLSVLVSNSVKIVRDTEINKTRAVSIKKIALLSGVVALFMAIFSAFFIEYIKNVNRSTKQTK